jgi:LmbE family N-acetylglucosaminyl deacetylase
MGNRHRRCLFLLCLCLLIFLPHRAFAQRSLAGAVQTRLAIERLNVLGSVLMIAAHPDDENTALLAYFARGRKFRTAYLSLTRGEGGQNLIGPEQGDLLGIIRTQELLAARRIDGAEQLFTRAIDFGFSKSAEETLAKWGHEKVLADVVWNIRRFRPDVILLVFSGTPRDGHGHHQSSAILAKEAFAAAADRNRFPEQLKWVEPWHATRMFWNVFYWSAERERVIKEYPDHVRIDPGEFDPVLGYSYAEIAGMSRSMHRSQGFGAAERKGRSENYLVVVAGEPAKTDPFDGIDTSWKRVPSGAEIGAILEEAARTFRPERPEETVPLLLKARPLVAAIKHPWATRKLAELDETIALCTGLWLDASAERYSATPGSSLKVETVALNRSRFPLKLAGVAVEGADGAPGGTAASMPLDYNQPVRQTVTVSLPPDQPYSQPFWLREPKDGNLYRIGSQELVGVPESPAALRARFRLGVGSQEIELVRPVAHRYVDRVTGEQVRPLDIVPPVVVRIAEPVRMFPDAHARPLGVRLKANGSGVSGDVLLRIPSGWKASPERVPFRMSQPGEERVLSFDVTPPAGASRGEVTAVAVVGGREISSGSDVIEYPHIPPQAVFPPARAELVRTDVSVLARRIGYVVGAGDELPQALRQLGCEVTLLSEEELTRGDLGQFDAIVTGVRAYNVRPDLLASQQRLMDYVQGGGTLVVQYNVLPFGGESTSLGKLGPFPITVGRGRVSVEDAPVTFPNPDHPLLSVPNRITSADFEGWVQERGLYFASEWDARYETLFESHDPGEDPLPGGALYTRYGKGVYIFTAYSWFRQLPAGVPGAFRIFANFLSAGRSVR